ncbi:MAG TPA: hypothetical protein PLW14_08605 [Chlorobiota bacterium]|nr:hypothetical protein [Chlorobiota bacterium]
METHDVQNIETIGRSVEKLANPISLWLTDALTYAIGPDHITVVRRLLSQRGQQPLTPTRNITSIRDLDLPDLLRLFDCCYYLPRHVDDTENDLEWKHRFLALFGVTNITSHKDRGVKALQTAVEGVRNVRNNYAHKAAGATFSKRKTLGALTKLHDLVTDQLRVAVHNNPDVFTTETRSAVDFVSNEIDVAIDKTSRVTGRRKGLWPVFTVAAAAVIALVIILPRWISTDYVSEVFILGHQRPNDAALDTLTNYLHRTLDSGSVRIRLITKDGLDSTLEVVRSRSDSLTSEDLKSLLSDFVEIDSVKKTIDFMTTLLRELDQLKSNRSFVQFITLGSSGAYNQKFANDYERRDWNYTPLDLGTVLKRFQQQKRLHPPVFILPLVSNRFDTLNDRSFDEAGIPSQIYRVEKWTSSK